MNLVRESIPRCGFYKAGLLDAAVSPVIYYGQTKAARPGAGRQEETRA